MNLPGSNELKLCGAALCEIVQKYLEDTSNYRSSAPLVTSVSYSASSASYVFDLEQRPEEPKK